MTDSVEFTARAHSEAARRPASRDAAIPDGSAAADAARDASGQILAHPTLAARAQANSDGATVLAMLQ